MLSGIDLSLTVRKLREQNSDDAHVEVKKCAGGLSKDVWETVSAFANTKGGLIILGISEPDGFTAAEGFDLKRVRDQFVGGIGDGGTTDQRMTNPPRYAMERFEFEGTQLLAIKIEENPIDLKPCFITDHGVQRGSYKRVDDKDIRLSPTEIYELQTALIPSPADQSIVAEASMEDLDSDLVDKLVIRAQNRGSKALRGATTREMQLARLGASDKNGGIRLAGLLALGLYPQQFYPKLVVDVTAHPDNEKASPGNNRFDDREICEGPLGEVIEDALGAIARNLRKRATVEGLGRTEQLEIPIEALREALVNAVIHREYSPLFTGQSVSVDIYPNRVVITNPGGLWGGKTIDNLQDGTSRCRNEMLMRIMSGLPLPSRVGSPAEGQGSGIILIARELEERGLPAPRFRAEMDFFSVTFARQNIGEVGIEEPRTPITAKRTSSMEARAMLLDALEPDMALNVRELAAATGLSVNTIRSSLKALVAEGILVPTAPSTSKLRKYVRVNADS